MSSGPDPNKLASLESSDSPSEVSSPRSFSQPEANPSGYYAVSDIPAIKYRSGQIHVPSLAAAMDVDDDSISGAQRVGPPSSASSGSAIAVGSSSDAALIQSIEKGEYMDDGEADETKSLSDSIRQHIVDGGLRYHAYHAGSYAFPNDETEQYRDDLKHHLSLHLCEGHPFFAPVGHVLDQGGAVLDLGTGTGIWCIDLADLYPHTEIHGMDLSPIQPDWVPGNVQFVVDDIEHESGWTYPDTMFDFIHIRHTTHSIRNRTEMMNRVLRHLKPGGYFEVQEFHYVAACDDDSCDGPFAWRDFLRYLHDGMGAMGQSINGAVHVENAMREAGFEDINTRFLKCPIGPWPKKRRLQECGYIMRDNCMWGLQGLARRPFRDGLRWTAVQIEMFLVEVRKSLSANVNGIPTFHSYFPFQITYGRKPVDAA